MSWPLTGNDLSRFNRLLDDLRQYGDFYFTGSPDDITFLWQTVIAASNGTLNPPLDDVANRSHYWLLRLVSFLGDQINPTPPPLTEQTGIQFGPDSTEIHFPDDSFFLGNSGMLDHPGIDSIEFSNLLVLDDEGSGNAVEFSFFNAGGRSFSFPKLQTVTADQLGSGSEQTIASFSAPKLVTVNGNFYIYDNPITFLDLSSLETVTGDFDVLDRILVTSASLPAFTGAGGFFYFGSQCPNLQSVSAPALVTSENVFTDQCPTLTSVNLNALTTVGSGGFQITNCASLPSLTFPSLTSVGSNVSIFGSPLLASVSFPLFLPTDGTTLDFSDNGLTTASVNHVLARAVANPGYVSGLISTAGGTNSAPTGQGIIDKATLQGRGVSVFTN